MTSSQKTVSVQADDTVAQHIPDQDDRAGATEVRPAFVTLAADDTVGVCTVDGVCS
ncbi:hypothetical protein ACWD4O_42615 [Streptomyces sp. NPDC002623]